MKRYGFLALLVVLLLSLTVTAVLADSPIQTAADKYFSGGTKNMKAADLYANLNDGDKSNDPYMIDIRAAADYANGHIPGAVNMTAKDLFSADGLAKLPKNKPIVVNCYTGQTASQTTAALRMMGYDAYNLLYGIPGWGFNDKVKYLFLAEQSGKYPVSKDAVQLSGTNEAPKPLGDTVEAAAMAYFPNGFKAIKAADLYANLNDGDKSNDPVIIDVRKAEDYAAGHIVGAANVTVGNLFKTDTLAKLPKNKQVVLYCYSGQTASQATAALRMLGYDAYNMQFGMAAWAIVDSTSSPVWEQDKSSGKYTLEVSAAPAAAAASAAAAPKTAPTTGGPLSLAFALSGLSLIGAGLALRKR